MPSSGVACEWEEQESLLLLLLLLFLVACAAAALDRPRPPPPPIRNGDVTSLRAMLVVAAVGVDFGVGGETDRGGGSRMTSMAALSS